MAVGVNGNVPDVGFKLKSSWLLPQQLIYKLFEKKTALSYFVRAGNFQFTVIFGEHRITGWLEKQDRRFSQRHVALVPIGYRMFRVLRGTTIHGTRLAS